MLASTVAYFFRHRQCSLNSNADWLWYIKYRVCCPWSKYLESTKIFMQQIMLTYKYTVSKLHRRVQKVFTTKSACHWVMMLVTPLCLSISFLLPPYFCSSSLLPLSFYSLSISLNPLLHLRLLTHLIIVHSTDDTRCSQCHSDKYSLSLIMTWKQYKG